MNAEEKKIQEKNHNSEGATKTPSIFWQVVRGLKFFLAVFYSTVVIMFFFHTLWILFRITEILGKNTTGKLEARQTEEVKTMETEAGEKSSRSTQKSTSTKSSTDRKMDGFIKNNIVESSNWVDNCSCSEKVRSEISLYFDSGRQDRIHQYLKSPANNLLNRNFIFHGEPGTGKSYCALQIAKGISSSYIVVPGGTLQKIYVGSGSMQWKKIIDNAKSNAEMARDPVVIIVEEIDSLAGRKVEPPLNSNDDTLVNSFLESIDSIRNNDLKIIIIGTTNVIDSMEPAATRIGRFNKLHFEYPGKEALDNILKGVRKEVENNYNVEILNTDEDSGNACLENKTLPDNKKFIFIYNSYWNCLKDKILASLSVLKNEYPIIFPQVSSCVERMIRETINSAEVPTLGKDLGYKTGEYILELDKKKLPKSSSISHKIIPPSRKELFKIDNLTTDQVDHGPSNDGQENSLYAEISKIARGKEELIPDENQWNEVQQNQSSTTVVESDSSRQETVEIGETLRAARKRKEAARDSAEK